MDNKQLEGRFKKYSNDIEYTGSSNKFFGMLVDNSEGLNALIGSEKSYQDFKTPKDSVFLQPFLRELIKSPNCHYKTSFNHLIPNTAIANRAKCVYESTYIPNHIPCLVKKTRSDLSVVGECVGCRVANELGIDTAYNFALKYQTGQFKNEEKLYPEDYDVIVSLDVVPDGYKIEDLQTIGFRERYDANIVQWFDTIDKEFVKVAKTMGIDCSEEKISKFKKDLAFQLFFRVALCGDIDCDAKNLNIIYNDKGDFYLAPNLDMEFMFTDRASDGILYPFVGSQLRALKEFFPQETESFMKRLQEFVSSEKLDAIFNETVDADTTYARQRFIKGASCVLELNELALSDLPEKMIVPSLYKFGEGLETPQLSDLDIY
ncbi:MAG: hypothetical protein IJW59_01660 [Clostridia bacterium]|nr:hypothetical protein [Clostridia bacterium]